MQVGAVLAESRLVRAATDITGFGLIGHLATLCRASGVCADIDADAVPVISDEVVNLVKRGCVPGGSRENLSSATVIVDWKSTPNYRRILLADAQTSGGLLLCVAEARLSNVCASSGRPDALRSGDRENCQVTPAPVEMHDKMKSGTRRGIPAVNKVLEAWARPIFRDRC